MGAKGHHKLLNLFSQFSLPYDHGKKFQECSPEEFLEYRFKKKEEQEKLLMGYLQEHEIKDFLLKKWVGYFITYQPLNNLLGYPILHAQFNKKRPQDLNIPESYYDFMLDEIEVV